MSIYDPSGLHISLIEINVVVLFWERPFIFDLVSIEANSSSENNESNKLHKKKK